jgi:hypothetical protein
MSNPTNHPRPKISEDPGELRRRAELRLREQKAKTSPNRTHADNERQVHELEVRRPASLPQRDETFTHEG